MTLALDANDGIVFTGGSELELAVTKPDTMTHDPQDLRRWFQYFSVEHLVINMKGISLQVKI